MSYQTLNVRFEDAVCFVQLCRRDANNAISAALVEELLEALTQCDREATVVVLEGLPDVFCSGADFRDIGDQIGAGRSERDDPERLYAAWLKLATGPYVTVAHVRGKVNAGGIGFVAASDIAIASADAYFSLSEMLFGLFPACVMPFLVRRVGKQRAHYLTLMTVSIRATQAQEWGLVDACEAASEKAVRVHLRRLKCLSKPAIARYKAYMHELDGQLARSCSLATAANREMFADPQNLERIQRYVETGRLPWDV